MTKPIQCMLAVAVLAAAAAGAATEAAAQDASPDAAARAAAVDPRWFPWLGCWQLREEQLDPSAPDAGAETAALLDRTVICVRPHGAGPGVTLTTAAGDRVLAERTLVADGVRRDVQATDCPGRERSAWSRDGRRLFTHAELRCADQPARTVTGVSLLSSRSTWVDVQVVAIGGRQMVEIRRYNPLPASAQDDRPESAAPGVAPADVRQARREAAAPLDLRDVMEASSTTSPRVVEALLVETEPRLPLDSAALLALDDAGINGGVIDLLVALAYPERFVVERRDRGGAWSSGGWGGFSGFHDPIWYDRYYPYYVSPFGYYSWGRGYYPYLVGGYATPFVVLPGGDADAGRGRVVAGRGYTRVSPRGGSGGRRAVPRAGAAAPAGGSSGGGTVSRRGQSGGTVSRGGTGSRGGYSAGGGGTRTGRRAVPRR